MPKLFAGLLIALALVAADPVDFGDHVDFGSTYHMTGSDDVAIGRDALLNVTSGSGNIALGVGACRSVTTGNCNVCIGDGIDVPSPTISRYVNINGVVYSDPSKTKGLREGIIKTLTEALRSVGQDAYTKVPAMCSEGQEKR